MLIAYNAWEDVPMFRKVVLVCLLAILSYSNSAGAAYAESNGSLLSVTPEIEEYALTVVKPLLDAHPKRDQLSLLVKVSAVLNDPKTGVRPNSIPPSGYFFYHFLDKAKLGFFFTWKLSSPQKEMLLSWHDKYMKGNPADVFFAPSADDIVKFRAAFGCTHHARAFIAVVKALDLIDKPENMRYVISSKADDYNRALKGHDREMTINGHQFVILNIDSEWIALNTSTSEVVAMPKGFSPDDCMPPRNIDVRFDSYPPGVIFLLRKIGKDYNDDCSDNSLDRLMNISRSGDPRNAAFKWQEYVDATTPAAVGSGPEGKPE